MSKMIFMEKRFERPFNLSIEDSKNYGSGVGCNYFLLVKTDTLRRTSFEREKYFESYAAYFLVSSRTGKLILWTLSKFEEDSPGRSQQKLTASIENSVHELSEKIRSSEKENIIYGRESDDFKLENNFTGSEDFRPPMPYRRVKPQYTRTASLYDILATVDAAVDIDDAGNVKNIEILRWAGFGLDESVVKTILGLKWRPADLKGKPLAMRILLRYNFKNIETDSETDTK
ncbi:MAG: energy transducer TonB [Pyrinomonadaceae bacterium]